MGGAGSISSRARLYWNLNNIGVRSFIPTGAPVTLVSLIVHLVANGYHYQPHVGIADFVVRGARPFLATNRMFVVSCVL